ncbi:MAG: flagellum-specific ATP synthase FliI, partial [Gammaproteobacteria bacterium]
FRHWWSLFEQNRDLLSVGAYKPGSNPDLDRAIALQPHMRAFLRQGIHEKVTMAETLEQLRRLVEAGKGETN